MQRWPAAVVIVVVAIIAAEILPRLERQHHWGIGFAYDASTAQATLAAIAGGMITLTGFVLTAVTLIVQTVQSQSPRLLRALSRTDKTPLLFGTFTATFTFALLVLSQVRDDAVPTISVLLALALVLLSTAMFLRLLVTFRTTLTSGGLARTIGSETRRLIQELYPEQLGSGVGPPATPVEAARAVPGRAEPAPSRTPKGGPAWELRSSGPPGIFQAFDEAGVVRLAVAGDTEITFLPAVGDFVATGAPLATGRGPQPADLQRLVRIGPSRTLEQDPSYGIRLLADIAIRALSQAVNDPTSAVQVLDQLDDILHRLARRFLGNGRLHDAEGRVRVRWPAPAWESFLALAVDEIIVYGAGSLQVARRLRAMLTDLAASVPPARRPPVLARIATLDRMIRQSFTDSALQAEARVPDRQGIGSPRHAGGPG